MVQKFIIIWYLVCLGSTLVFFLAFCSVFKILQHPYHLMTSNQHKLAKKPKNNFSNDDLPSFVALYHHFDDILCFSLFLINQPIFCFHLWSINPPVSVWKNDKMIFIHYETQIRSCRSRLQDWCHFPVELQPKLDNNLSSFLENCSFKPTDVRIL